MLVQHTPSENSAATIFEETLTLIWAAYHLLRTVIVQMVVHLASFNDPATIIRALKLGLDAVIGDVLIHFVQD